MTTHNRRRRGLLAGGASWALGAGLAATTSRVARASVDGLPAGLPSGLTTGLPDPQAVQALQQSLHSLGRMEQSRITLRAPELAENGASVPVSIDSSLPGTTEMSIFVDTNPVPLAARFDIPQGTQAFASMRVKMAQSGRIYALVKADGETYVSFVETKVIVGGCG